MSRARAAAVCQTARACATQSPPIPYVLGGETAAKQDCQGHVEYCVRQNGGQMAYAGSNDMYRNACAWVGTLAEARAQGKLVPGALLFLVTRTGTYPERYHADGKGNASHVGLYIGDADILITHASASAGRVTTSTFASTWTHVGLAKAIEYEGGDAMEGTFPYDAIVTTSEGGLNFREAASTKSARLAGLPVIPRGSRVSVLSHSSAEWACVRYGGHTGYAARAYLTRAGEGSDGDGAGLRERMQAVYAAFGEALGVDGDG